MKALRWPGLLLVLLAAALGGCLGDDDVDEAPEDSADAQGTEGTGVVQGRVFTQDLEPLPGAAVVLANDERVQETKSGGDGRYEIHQVEPGQYRLQVNAACCREAVRGVQVSAGETVNMDARLDFYTDSDLRTPYVSDPHWEGLLACGVVANEGMAFNCGTADPNNDRSHTFEVKEGLETILVAMEWDSEFTNINDGMIIDLMNGDTRLAEGIGESPIEYRVDRADGTLSEIDDTFTLRFDVWAGGMANVIFQQPFTVYWEEHYWEPAPEGASALPDG